MDPISAFGRTNSQGTSHYNQNSQICLWLWPRLTSWWLLSEGGHATGPLEPLVTAPWPFNELCPVKSLLIFCYGFRTIKRFSWLGPFIVCSPSKGSAYINAILTRDNLATRKLQGPSGCVLCNWAVKTIDHLLLSWPFSDCVGEHFL